MKHFYPRSKGRVKQAAASEQGSGMLEYVLLVALVAFGMTAGLTSTAKGLTTAMSKVASNLSDAINASVPTGIEALELEPELDRGMAAATVVAANTAATGIEFIAENQPAVGWGFLKSRATPSLCPGGTNLMLPQRN